MGKMKENPKYNILSFRVTDVDYFSTLEAANIAGGTLADFLTAAVQEKIAHDGQKRMDEHLRTNGVK